MTTYYMHTVSGDVGSFEDWKNDFDCMDIESWFGMPIEECVNLHFIDDIPQLVEVKKDDQGDWVAA